MQPMDAGVVGALAASAEESGETFRQMPSGAAHDTQCVASRVPSAMVFVPCVDGLSHTPLEQADTGRRGARGRGRLLRDPRAGYFTRGERLRKSSAISSNVHQRTPSWLVDVLDDPLVHEQHLGRPETSGWMVMVNTA